MQPVRGRVEGPPSRSFEELENRMAGSGRPCGTRSPVLFVAVVNETPCKPDRYAALEGESGLVRINLTMRIRTLTCGSFLQMA